MNSQSYLWHIDRFLAWFTSHVQQENRNGNFDINKHAERFLIPILNEVFEKKFEKLEFIKQNHPAIDLGSKDKLISIQVTSQTGFGKIKDTLTKFIKHELYKTYSELYLLVIDSEYKTKKQNEDIAQHISSEIRKYGVSQSVDIKFLIEKHLLNMSDLMSLIEQKCCVDKLKLIHDFLEKEYGRVTALPSFKDVLIPYQVAFKHQLDKENNNLTVQFHKHFVGREVDLKKIDEFIHDSKKGVMAVVSDGGYGKTRLIIEVFNKYSVEEGYEAYLLNESAFQCLDFSEQLQTGKKILVLFDDAHNKPEILNDLLSIAERQENVKIILTSRKSVYYELVKSISTHLRYFDVLELDRLSYTETKELFKSQLKGLPELEIKRLSESSRGVPIVILGLCMNALEGKHRVELSEEENFSQFVRENKEQVIFDVHQKYYVDKVKVDKVIQSICFFSPIKNSQEEIIELAKITSIDFEEISLILDYLFESTFVSKNHEISIKPDPYSDAILLEALPRIKYLLQKDLRIFLDRFLRNLVKVENSQRFNLNIESLLSDFISSFKNKPTESIEHIRKLDINLNTLKSFAYKKPKFCFEAIKHLIDSKLEDEVFWENKSDSGWSAYSLKTIHNSIQDILSVIAINTHTNSELDSIYKLVSKYNDLRQDTSMLHTVFKYRIYDFNEYGYRPEQICERQQYLLNKLNKLIKEEITDEVYDHILNSCQLLLVKEFKGEDQYDKFTHTFSITNYFVPYSQEVKSLREEVVSILIQLYKMKRHSEQAKRSLDELIRVFFYFAEPNNNKYQLNQEGEIEIVAGFIKELLNDDPSIQERSSVIRQLKLFRRRGVKEKYASLVKEILDLAEKAVTPKDKLELAFYDDYFSFKSDIKNKVAGIIDEYSDLDSFYKDLISIKLNITTKEESNFREIISQLISNHPNEAKQLLDYVYEHYPEQICDYFTLIRANYKDQEYFYDIINKIWNLKHDKCVKGSVLWMLTYGRNRKVEFYKKSDLDFVESVIQSNLLDALWGVSLTISDFLAVSPERTIHLISEILKMDENKREIEQLFHGIFKEKEQLSEHAELIKSFIFKETLIIPLDSYYFEDALFFLEDNFGFDCLFDYLKRRVILLEKEKKDFPHSLHKSYIKPGKDNTQSEIDFLNVIKWYVDSENKNEFLHKKMVDFLRPKELSSKEFWREFEILVSDSGKDKLRVMSLFYSLDNDGEKSEEFITQLIKIVNNVCDEIEFENHELIQMFGSGFIRNTGFKSGSPGVPFPSDLKKRDELIGYMKNPMHDQVKEVFSIALKCVNNDIERCNNENTDEQW